MMDRLRSLPTWLRFLLATTPALMCIPLACIGVFAYQQLNADQSAAQTEAARNTRLALEASQRAEQDLLDAAMTGTAALAATERVRLGVTATFLFAQAQDLTRTALVTPSITSSPTLPTETPTRPFFTSTPKLVRIALRECRGYEGTVIFGQSQPQSIHAFDTMIFTVPPGTYNLRIIWLRHPENNVNIEVDAKVDQTIPFGSDCR